MRAPHTSRGQRLQASDLIFLLLSSSPWLVGLLIKSSGLEGDGLGLGAGARDQVLSASLHPASPAVPGSLCPLKLILRAGAEHRPPAVTPRVWPEREGQVSGDVLHRVDKGPGQSPTAGTPVHPADAVAGTQQSPRTGPLQTGSQTAPTGSTLESQQDTPRGHLGCRECHHFCFPESS